MSVLDRTRDATGRVSLRSLVVVCVVSAALGVGLSWASGALWTFGAISRLVFMVAAVVLIVRVVRRVPSKAWVLLVLALLAGGVVTGVVVSITQHTPTSENEQEHIAKLEPKAPQYAAATGRPAASKPHVSGRIVPVEVGKPRIDEAVYVRLPNELQARSPKEVSTVVKIKYAKDVVGHYRDGSKGIQESAEVTIVDLRSHTRYRAKTISGPDPPYAKRGGGDRSGGPPDVADIVTYLEHLPRRAASRSGT